MNKPVGKEVAPQDRAFGKRIADLRKERGLTQQQLAASMSGRTSSWMSQVERGIQPVRRLDVLQEFADALGVSTQALDPNAPIHMPQTAPATLESNDLDGARMVISGHPALDVLLGTDPSDGAVALTDLVGQVEEIWELTHQGKYSEISDMVTDLIPTLETAVRSVPTADQPAAYGLLARAYQALAAAFARQGDSRSSWVAADRAITAGELSGDELLVFASIYRMVHAFVRLGNRDQAEHVVRAAVDALSSRTDLSPKACRSSVPCIWPRPWCTPVAVSGRKRELRSRRPAGWQPSSARIATTTTSSSARRTWRSTLSQRPWTWAMRERPSTLAGRSTRLRCRRSAEEAVDGPGASSRAEATHRRRRRLPAARRGPRSRDC